MGNLSDLHVGETLRHERGDLALACTEDGDVETPELLERRLRPPSGCGEKQCFRGNDQYAYGKGVVIKGNWLLQDPLCNGYSALEAYLPSQRIAISLVVTFGEDAFDKTTGGYPNEAVPVFEQIGALLAPNDAPPPAPGDQTPPPGG